MKGYRTKRISLPGGKEIEIVYFYDANPDGDEDGGAEVTATQTVEDDPPTVDEVTAPARLHVCPDCDSDLVYPIAWEERASDRWRIERRCPNCEWYHVGEFGQAESHGLRDSPPAEVLQGSSA